MLSALHCHINLHNSPVLGVLLSSHFTDEWSLQTEAHIALRKMSVILQLVKWQSWDSNQVLLSPEPLLLTTVPVATMPVNCQAADQGHSQRKLSQVLRGMRKIRTMFWVFHKAEFIPFK